MVEACTPPDEARMNVDAANEVRRAPAIIES
jgi:hypothetical protein